MIHFAGFDQCLADFFDKEGIAVGFGVNAVEELGCDLFLKQRGQQRASLIAIEARQLQASRESLAMEVEQQLVKGRASLNSTSR